MCVYVYLSEHVWECIYKWHNTLNKYKHKSKYVASLFSYCNQHKEGIILNRKEGGKGKIKITLVTNIFHKEIDITSINIKQSQYSYKRILLTIRKIG